MEKNKTTVKFIFWCFPPVSYDKTGKRESEKIRKVAVDQIAIKSLRKGYVQKNLNNCFDK